MCLGIPGRIISLDEKIPKLATVDVGDVRRAMFDLGECAKFAILSVTEGKDKPLKYPHMFRASELMILNKIDLLPYLKFDVEKMYRIRQTSQSAHRNSASFGNYRRRNDKLV